MQPCPENEVLQRCDALLRDLLAHEDALASGSGREAAWLDAHLPLGLPAAGQPLDEVFARMAAVLKATPSSSSWRFLNQLFGGREPVAAAAESLAAWRNVSMYTFKAAGAQVLVEKQVLSHMLQKVGFGAGEAMFTPGGSLANLAALLVARDRADPQQRDAGARSGLTVYASSEAHYSIGKNAGIAGLGRRALRAVPVDRLGRMDVTALAALMESDRREGLRPLMIVATAGSTVRGTFDDIDGIATVARSTGAWLHVDGALGASLVLSRKHRHLLHGVDRADSVSWNPHKMMGVPLQASVLLLAERGGLARSLDERADYLFQSDEDELNPGHRSLQCGRRADAFKLWAAWQHLGDEGWEARLDRQMALAAHAADRVAADPALRLCERPMSINVCFEVEGCPAEALCERLDREGRLKIGHGDVAGRRALRLVCVNPALTDKYLGAILDEIKSAARRLNKATC